MTTEVGSPTNHDREDWVEEGLFAYFQRAADWAGGIKVAEDEDAVLVTLDKFDGDIEQVIADFLSDLRVFCDINHIRFADLDQRGERN